MFMIVSRDDFSLYEKKIENLVKSSQGKSKSDLFEFIINASLDSVDQLQWSSSAMYLKTVDRYNDCLNVNCLVTPSNARLMILYDNVAEDKLKTFLNEVYDLYSHLALNPFFSQTEKIQIE